MTITKSEVSALLSDALYGESPCIVPPGGDRWTASLLTDTKGPRIYVERELNNSFGGLGPNVLGAVDVSLSSELIEPEDGFTYEEVEAASWEQHVGNLVDVWADSIVEQVACAESRMSP